MSDGTIIVARASDHHSKTWRNETFPDVQTFLFKYFSEHEIGAKNGNCLTQGSLRGPRRIANQCVSNYILMFDHDNGETMDEIADNINPTGLACVLSTTHSHLKTTTNVTENAIVTHRRRNKLDDYSDLDVCKHYLINSKKWIERIADTIESVDIQHLDGGKTFVVHHGPMPRTRSLFVLEEPYHFIIDGVPQKDRINEWKDRYKGFADTVLKVGTDPTCIDPSRLMYLPRCDAAMKEHAEIRDLPGTALVRLVDMPRFSESAEVKSKSTKEKGTKIFKTRGLRSFVMGEAGQTFRAADFMQDYNGDPLLVRDGKAHYTCPWDDLHSNAGDADDRGFFCTSADGDKGWSMYCMHDGCQTETSCDRAQWLDKACENAGIVDAVELMKYTDAKEISADDMDLIYQPVIDMEELVKSLTKDTPPKIVSALLWQIHRECDTLETSRWLDQIKTKTGYSKPDLLKQLKSLTEKVAPKGNVEEAPPSNADIPPPPLPGEVTLKIYNDWEYHEKFSATKDAIALQNSRRELLFRTTLHEVVRVRETEGATLLTQLEKPVDWTQQVRKLGLEFFNSKSKTMQPPAQIMSDMHGEDNWPTFPVIERVADVPVFGPNGELLTTNGYHPGSRIWLNARLQFLPVPNVITEADVSRACEIFAYVLQDFPFSDVFTGNDPLPVRTEDGGANWERGIASRAHAICLLLQPFARALIRGSTPMFFIDKPVKGTGAGYLANILGSMLHDSVLPVTPPPEKEEEFEKRITSFLLEGSPVIFLDNLNHELSSASLAGALTGGIWNGRRLGHSEIVKMPVTCTWLLTANRGSISDELMRRVAPIRLDAQCANPDVDRPADFYAIKDFPGYLKDNRQELVWAAHVLIKNYVQRKAAGEDSGNQMILQSFQAWSQVMGDILAYAQIEGFLGNIRVYTDTRRNEDSSALEITAEALYEALGEREVFETIEAADALSGGSGLTRGTGAFDAKFAIFIRNPDDPTERMQKVGLRLHKMQGRPFEITNGRQVTVSKGARGEWALHLTRGENVVPLRAT